MSAEPSAGRILIIEDDQDIADLIRAQLQKEGFRVEVAPGGQEGIDAALADPPDVVILDLRMNPVDGFQVLRALGDHVVTRQIPVLVVSILEEEGRARAAGAKGFVLKPFRPANVTEAVRQLLM
ncbi:MAG: response regulator [Actinomycetota bacterium]|nr:response regulator [Actinomycetota bacterium]